MTSHRRDFHTAFFPLVTALAFLILAACHAQQPPQNAAIRIIPSELFTGDLKRLEPHLRLNSGCVKLDYSGPEANIHLQVEIWKNGKIVEQVMRLTPTLSGPSEGCISLKETTDAKGRPMYQVVTALSQKNGFMSGTSQVDAPELNIRTRQKLKGAVELSKDKPIAVWGLMAGKGVERINSNESVEDIAKRVEWALVLKLSLDKK